MAAPSVCHQFATSIISFFAPYSEVTLEVRFPIDRILRDNEQGSELDGRLEGRKLRRLQELDKLLEESLRSSSQPQEKRNECEFASGIQDLVEPLPQITVSISRPMYLRKNFDLPLEHFLDALLELVVKFRTKLHIAFSIPDESAELLQTAILRDYVGLAKLVVVMEPLRISNNSCLCPATVVAKVMKCASRLEVVTLLLEMYRDPRFDQPNLLQTMLNDMALWNWGTNYQYADFFLKHIGTLPSFWRSFCWRPECFPDCYSRDSGSTHKY
ncbi:unnamed protein product [Sphagnum tenellum]